MNDLHLLQSDFLKSLFAQGENSETLPLRHSERFYVYQNGYPARVDEALRETFARSSRLLGYDRWMQLLNDFCKVYRSQSHDLYGACKPFLNFMSSPVSGASIAELELMQLEFFISESFHAARSLPLSREEISEALQKPETKVSLQAHVRLLQARTAPLKLWSAIGDIDTASRSTEELTQQEMDPESVLVYRLGDEVQMAPMPQAGNLLLRSLQEGMSVGDSFSRLEESGLDCSPEQI